jgi:hypothetical protein
VQRGGGRGHPLGEAAEHPRHVLAQLAAARLALRARAARDGVSDQHALAGVLAHADGLVAEARGIRPEDQVTVAQRLRVGRAGGRGLDGDQHVAVGL